MAFPDFGLSLYKADSMTRNGFEQGGFFFQLISGDVFDPGGAPVDGIYYLALTAAMIGGFLILLMKGNQKPIIIFSWLFLVLVTIIGPYGGGNNTNVFFKDMQQYALEKHLKKTEKSVTDYSDTHPVQDLAFYPQLLIVHVMSTLHRAIDYALYYCDEQYGSGCRLRNMHYDTSGSVALSQLDGLALRDRDEIVGDIVMYGELCPGNLSQDILTKEPYMSKAQNADGSYTESLTLPDRVMNQSSNHDTFTLGEVHNAIIAHQKAFPSGEENTYPPIAILPSDKGAFDAIFKTDRYGEIPFEESSEQYKKLEKTYLDNLEEVKKNEATWNYLVISSNKLEKKKYTVGDSNTLKRQAISFDIPMLTPYGVKDPLLQRVNRDRTKDQNKIYPSTYESSVVARSSAQQAAIADENLATKDPSVTPVVLAVTRGMLQTGNSAYFKGQTAFVRTCDEFARHIRQYASFVQVGQLSDKENPIYDIDNTAVFPTYKKNIYRDLLKPGGLIGKVPDVARDSHGGEITGSDKIWPPRETTDVTSSHAETPATLLLRQAFDTRLELERRIQIAQAEAAGDEGRVDALKGNGTGEGYYSAALIGDKNIMETVRLSLLNDMLAIGFRNAMPEIQLAEAGLNKSASEIARDRHMAERYSDLKNLNLPADWMGKIAVYFADVIVTATSWFKGANIATYLKYMMLMVAIALMFVLMITPLIYLMGILIPSYAPGVLIVSLGAVLILKMVPITFTLVDAMMSLAIGILEGGIENSLLMHVQATVYTSIVGITLFILFKIGDPKSLGQLGSIDGAANKIADAAESAVKVAAMTGAAMIGAGAAGAIGGGLIAGKGLKGAAVGALRQGTEPLKSGASKVPVIGEFLQEANLGSALREGAGTARAEDQLSQAHAHRAASSKEELELYDGVIASYDEELKNESLSEDERKAIEERRAKDLDKRNALSDYASSGRGALTWTHLGAAENRAAQAAADQRYAEIASAGERDHMARGQAGEEYMSKIAVREGQVQGMKIAAEGVKVDEVSLKEIEAQIKSGINEDIRNAKRDAMSYDQLRKEVESNPAAFIQNATEGKAESEISDQSIDKLIRGMQTKGIQKDAYDKAAEIVYRGDTEKKYKDGAEGKERGATWEMHKKVADRDSAPGVSELVRGAKAWDRITAESQKYERETGRSFWVDYDKVDIASQVGSFVGRAHQGSGTKTSRRIMLEVDRAKDQIDNEIDAAYEVALKNTVIGTQNGQSITMGDRAREVKRRDVSRKLNGLRAKGNSHGGALTATQSGRDVFGENYNHDDAVGDITAELEKVYRKDLGHSGAVNRSSSLHQIYMDAALKAGEKAYGNFKNTDGKSGLTGFGSTMNVSAIRAGLGKLGLGAAERAQAEKGLDDYIKAAEAKGNAGGWQVIREGGKVKSVHHATGFSFTKRGSDNISSEHLSAMNEGATAEDVQKMNDLRTGIMSRLK